MKKKNKLAHFFTGVLFGVLFLSFNLTDANAIKPFYLPKTPQIPCPYYKIPYFKSFLFSKCRPTIVPTNTPIPTTSPTPTPTISSIPTPTLTPTPTPTPIITLTPTPTLSPTPTPFFTEEFDSIKLDTWSMYPNGGIIKIGSGEVNLEGNSSSKFPFFLIKFNPFPQDGNFSIETRLNYSQFGEGESGFAFSTSMQNPNILGSPFIDPSLGGVWPTGIGFNLNNISPMPGLGYHIYRFSFLAPKYWKIYIDETKVAEIENATRPQSLWFGASDPTSRTSWSNIGLDYIRVYGYDK